MIKFSTLWLWSMAALFAAFTLPVIAQQHQPQGPQAEPAAAPAATDQYKAPERPQERMQEKDKQQDSATTPPRKQRQAKGKNSGSQPDTVIR